MTTPHGDDRSARLEQLRAQYGARRPEQVAAPATPPAPAPEPRPAQAPLGGVPAHGAQPQAPIAPQAAPPVPGYGTAPAPQPQTGVPTGHAPVPSSPGQAAEPVQPSASPEQLPQQAPPAAPLDAAPAPVESQPEYPAHHEPVHAAPTQAGTPGLAPPQRPQPSAPVAEPAPAPIAAAPTFRAAVRPDEVDYFDEEDSTPFSPVETVREDANTPGFDEVAVASRGDKATIGWKGWLNRNLGMSLPRSEEELERDQQIGIINSTIRYPQVIGFYGAKGGVGKSSLTQMIGSTISYYRSTGGGMVGVDIDANSSLLSLMVPNTPNPQISSVARMSRDLDIRTASDINSHLVFNHDNFAVLPGVAMTDDNPLSPAELRRVLDTLARNYTLVGLDFPGSPEVPLAMQALHWLDYLVFVVAVTPVSIGNAKRELRRISEQCPALISNATVVLNHGGWGSNRTAVQNLDRHVQTIKNLSPTGDLEVFEVNYDAHIAEAARLERERTEPSSQAQLLRIAAHVVSKLPKGQPNFLGHTVQ